VIDEKIATPDAYSALPPTTRIKVHKALLEHMDLIDAFANENPFGFDETDLEIVRSWKHLVAGTFYAYRQLQQYMVFLSSTEPVIAYGVVALFDPFEVVIGPHPGLTHHNSESGLAGKPCLLVKSKLLDHIVATFR